METPPLSEMEKLRADVDSLSEKMGAIDNNIKDIRMALLGSEYNERGGIVKKMNDYEQRIFMLEEKIRKFTWLIIGLAGGAGAGAASILQTLVDLFTLKHK